MNSTPNWTHPRLGTFFCRDGIWRTKIHLPAFKPFTFNWSEGQVKAGDVSMGVESEKSCHLYGVIDNNPPNDNTIALVEDIIDSQHLLAVQILSAMWLDLLGDGPQSGMWWHGKLDTLNAENEKVARNVRNLEYINDPSIKQLHSRSDLLDIMGLTSIVVCNPNDSCNEIHAIFGFATTFEVEHGVGIMSDGVRVLGIGYLADVLRFRPPE